MNDKETMIIEEEIETTLIEDDYTDLLELGSSFVDLEG